MRYGRGVGLYEPILVLATIVVIYGVSCAMSPKAKRLFLWWLTAIIVTVGVSGATSDLLRGRTLAFPSSQD